VQECVNAGVWLSELPFSWRLEDCPQSISTDNSSDCNSEERQIEIQRAVVSASLFWRGRRAFSGWVVYLLLVQDAELVSYRTILNAGGAKVHDKLDAFICSPMHEFKLVLTDCSIEKLATRALESIWKRLKNAKIPILRTEFTLEWLEGKGEATREAFAV